MNVTKIDVSKSEYKPIKNMPMHTLLIGSCGKLAIRDDTTVVFLDKEICILSIGLCSDQYKIFDGELILKN